MTTKHAGFADRPDFERIVQENASILEEMRIVREDLEEERRTNGQLLETLKTRQNEDSKKLAEAKKLSETLAEENAQLKAEIRSSCQGRRGSNFGGQFLKELENFGQKIEILHRDLMNSNLMKNIKGKHGVSQGKTSFHLNLKQICILRFITTCIVE